MNIVIDAYQASPHITGSDRLAYNMLRELQGIDRTNEYTVMVNGKYDFMRSAISAPNFRVWPVIANKRAIWLTFRLPLLLLQFKADVFYSFYNLSGPGIRTCRTIISLLDMIPVERPDLYFGKDSSAMRKRIVSFVMNRSTKVANHYTAISKYTKEVAVETLGLPADKIDVIYLQADPLFFEPVSSEQLKAVAKKYNLPKSFVFTLGASEPRKNVGSLVLAHRQLPEVLRQQYPLLIGGAKWHNEEVDLGDDPFTRLLGFIDDSDLPVVYRLATTFAFPSQYEGFGLTVLEAFASDTAVITSNTTSLPEAAGEAALLVNPSDVNDIAAALKKVLTNSKYRDSLVKAGREQVKQFSWEKAAKRVHHILVETKDPSS